MICLKCGYCCANLCVVVVDDPEKGLDENNLIYHSGTKGKCKHLKGNTIGKYSCAIHDREWYDETPCFNHSQIERGNTNCRTGEYMLKKFKDKSIEEIFKKEK